MRLRQIVFSTPAVLAFGLSACAPAATTAVADAEPSTARCFRSDSVRNFRVAGNSDIYIRSLSNDVFLINTSGGCPDLDSALSIAIMPTAGGSETVCVSDPVRVVVPDSLPGRSACRAFVTKSLTDEEVAALPGRSRP